MYVSRSTVSSAHRDGEALNQIVFDVAVDLGVDLSPEAVSLA